MIYIPLYNKETKQKHMKTECEHFNEWMKDNNICMLDVVDFSAVYLGPSGAFHALQGPQSSSNNNMIRCDSALLYQGELTFDEEREANRAPFSLSMMEKKMV